jgi:hypothetical protein
MRGPLASRRPPLPPKSLRFAAKWLQADGVSALLSGEIDAMKTLAVIFLLALGAVAGSIYTDVLFTSEQVDGSANDLPIMQGESHASLAWH